MKRAPDIIELATTPTLASLLAERVRRSPDHIAYRYYDKSTRNWRALSWREAAMRVELWRSALMAEDLHAGDRVALMLPNGPDWLSFDLAAHQLGLIVVPLYLNDRPDNVAYILEDTQAKVFLLPGGHLWQQFHKIISKIDHLQRIVTTDLCQETEDDRLVCLLDWLPAKPRPAPSLAVKDHDTATIVYTSGTTGPPKGVMLSHHNILTNAAHCLGCVDIFTDDLFLSFLPLSHMLERTVGYYLPIMAGATVAFSRSIPELGDDLRQIRPTIMVAVPRIFERIHNALQEEVEAAGPFARQIFTTAVAIGWQHFEYRQRRARWRPSFLIKPLLDRLVGKKVLARLGGRLRIVVSGGASLSPDLARVFIGLGLPIYQGYGLTETSPVVSVNRPENNDPRGVGLPLTEVEVTIGDQNELLVRGPCVMQGYWNREMATRQVIDRDGWLHTGDQATLVEGHIRITGRLKEIIVLSNGEKVSPGDMEQAIASDPLFEQILVVGEGKPCLALLAVLSRPRWEIFAGELGVSPEAVSLKRHVVQAAILSRVEQQIHDMPGYAFIKIAVLTLEPWTVENGLLTPTLKVRREKVQSHLQQEIDQLFRS
ncbi:MAG: AMP-dependent synthetase/ligase [Desulfopila sp.]